MHYNFALLLFKWGIELSAFFGHKKAIKIVEGNRNWKEKLKAINPENRKLIWFHAASLGEFEQGRPLIERVRKEKSDYFILLSFFSPSGFEVHQNYGMADHVCYLPLDTKKNAKAFVEILKPNLVVFIKYEFWYNYLTEIKKKGIKCFMISVIFNQNHVFFKWYGSWFRKQLSSIHHFFLQDENSKSLLQEIGYSNATVAGDTRFDRVIELSHTNFSDAAIENFCQNRKVIVLGSAWEKEMEFARKYSAESEEHAFIIAPHEINSTQINAFIESLNVKGIPYSAIKQNETMSDYKVLVIDQIGKLSKIYRYAKFAIVGGGFGKGIHNLLEAAVYGVPVIFGPNYTAFKEAKDLIECGGGFSVSSYTEFLKIAELLSSAENLEKAAIASKKYVLSKAGATEKIYASLIRS